MEERVDITTDSLQSGRTVNMGNGRDERTRHYLQKTCRELQRPLASLTPKAMRALEAYDWPGNVREM